MTTDVYSAAKRSEVMARVKGRDTGPERAVRRLLWSAGYRYRLNRKDLSGTPDIVLPGRKAVVFVHGCFWHGHDCARGARQPKANADYWRAKIARNVARDVRNAETLRSEGWWVSVIWECELKALDALAARLTSEIDGAR